MIKGRGNDRMKEKKRKKKRVIPGFGLSFGITIAMLGFIVVIPLCTPVSYTHLQGSTSFPLIFIILWGRIVKCK